MTNGEKTYHLLTKLAAEGAKPRKRERAILKLATSTGLSSDALRAAARRYATKHGLPYPLMRSPPVEDRRAVREAKRQTRAAWKAERIRLGQEALARGAGWAEVAKLFGITTPEGAAQWWRRQVEGRRQAKLTRRRGKR